MNINNSGTELQILRPNDFHIHLRDKEMLEYVLPFSKDFGHILVMPNTLPPISTGEDLIRYKNEVQEVINRYSLPSTLKPHFVIKMMDTTTPEIVREAKRCGAIGIKIYPEGVTTNSEDGVSDWRKIYPALEAAQEEQMVIEIHGETPHDFILEREKCFLTTLYTLVRDFPSLKFVLEHITTREAVHAVLNLPDTVAATITVHHLLITLDDVLADKQYHGEYLNPHNYCKPIAKTLVDREELRFAATSGHKKFFYGGDSAPHPRSKKESGGCCAGVFNASVAIPLIVELFEKLNSFSKIEGFMSTFGAEFYGLEQNKDYISLKKETWKVKHRHTTGIIEIIPFRAGKEISWKVVE